MKLEMKKLHLMILVMLNSSVCGEGISHSVYVSTREQAEIKLRDGSLASEQIMGRLHVKKQEITRQKAEEMFRLKGLRKETYTLISIWQPRERKALGGGTMFALYDPDTWQLIKFFRTR